MRGLAIRVQRRRPGSALTMAASLEESLSGLGDGKARSLGPRRPGCVEVILSDFGLSG